LLHDHDADDLRTEKYRGYDFSDLINRMKSPSNIKRSNPPGNAKVFEFSYHWYYCNKRLVKPL